MGGGTSALQYAAPNELSADDKGTISRRLRGEYDSYLSVKGGDGDDVELFNKLKETYDKSLHDLSLRTVESTVSEQQDLSISTENLVTSPSHSAKFSPSLNMSSPSALGSTPKAQRRLSSVKSPDVVETVVDYVDDDAPVVRGRTSTEIVEEINDMMKSSERIASFISQIKDGEILTKNASEFRARRLTYAQQVSNGVGSPSPTSSKKRTTIYASSELGVSQKKKPPFPPQYMGTYSCHGVEPFQDDEGESGTVEKINQDRGCVVYPFRNSMQEALFMVLDGHGHEGDQVAEFVMRQMVVSLEKHPSLSSHPEEALKDTFNKTNTALMATPIEYMTSGCTCVCIYVRDKEIYVANCGDSRAVMATVAEDGAAKARDLSIDHKPDDPLEEARIKEWGGYVLPPLGPGLSARVYLDPQHTKIGLAMARSIGDFAVKAVGVISEPEVKRYDVSEQDAFFIMASDGVWEFISSQEAVDIVCNSIEYGCYEACEELIQVSAERWSEEEGDYRDDITAIVVRLPLPHQLEYEI